jgi:hypothetical protein
MTATFHIPNTPAWPGDLEWAFSHSKPGDVIHVMTRLQYLAAGHVLGDHPGVTVRLGEVVEQSAESLDNPGGE